MKQTEPPRWMENLLKLLLEKEQRETVSGDLYEEFCDEKLPSLGAARARIWYMTQVLSFIPQKFGPLLTAICCFTMASGAWLGAMDLRLRHPGYAGREWIAALIVGQAALTLAALHVAQTRWLRNIAMMGCAGILWLATKALIGVISGANFEGYILLIALGLVIQAVLTLGILPTVDRTRSRA